MTTHDIVVVGASAGGVKALRTLVAALPASYRGALLVVMHLNPRGQSRLAEILAQIGTLPAVTASDGMAIQPGRIHIAPNDQHMLVDRGVLRTVRGPKENRHRPSIDPLFRSAAWTYGPRVVGVVLSGSLDDGSAGLWAIKSCGGITVAQEPEESEYPEMPVNALMRMQVDHRLRLAQIADLLVQLAQEPVDPQPAHQPPETIKLEIDAAQLKTDVETTERLGALSPFTCPACRGALWEIEEAGHLRYRCHVGHAYAPASLLVEQDDAVEKSVFIALRAVEEKAVTLRRLASRWPDQLAAIKTDYEKRARELEVAASTLKEVLAGTKR